MNECMDNSVIRACQRGDKAAYAVLVNACYKGVFALCLGILGNTHDAEDAAQEAMLKGFLRISRLRRPYRFEPWILQIARNLCIDHVRRQQCRRTALMKEAGQSAPQADDYDDLQRAIKRLPQELRLPLIMFYFDGKNARTIAEKLNISHSGACQKIRAARQRLHELLTERAHDE